MDLATSGNKHVFASSRVVTIFEAAEFREAFITLQANEGPVELNLSGAGRMDTAGIQLLIAAERSGRLTVTGWRPAVREALATIGCLHLEHAFHDGRANK
jgi:anti-anti-sigma regulatory factor